MAIPKSLSATDLSRIKKTLGMTSGQLAEELGVAPLTVRRWEEPTPVDLATDGKRRRGRPSGIPRHVALALDFLTLREGVVAAEPKRVKVVLPRVLGSLLMYEAGALSRGFGLDFGEPELVATGGDALLAIAAEKAHLGAAAAGLIAQYQDSVVDAGILFRSNKAFALLACAADDLQLGTEEKQFRNRTLLYPEGSDLGNILPAALEDFGVKKPRTEGVSETQAVGRFAELLKPKGKNAHAVDCSQIVYVAWEPELTRLKENLRAGGVSPPAGTKWRIVPITVERLSRGLPYELHLVCSKKWVEAEPALALQLVLCLAQASLKYQGESIRAIQQAWTRLEIKKEPVECRQDRDDHDIRYQPSVELLQRIAHRVLVFDHKALGMTKTEAHVANQ